MTLSSLEGCSGFFKKSRRSSRCTERFLKLTRRFSSLISNLYGAVETTCGNTIGANIPAMGFFLPLDDLYNTNRTYNKQFHIKRPGIQQL